MTTPTNQRRHLDAVAGLILLAVVGGLGALGILAANGAFGDDYQIVAHADRAGFGLDDTSDVKVRGITIGEVESLDLLEDGTVAVI